MADETTSGAAEAAEAIPNIDPTLVTVGKPCDGGCVWTSFLKSPTIPQDAVTDMAGLGGYESLGDLDSDGFTEVHEISSSDHESWHGIPVLTTVDSERRRFRLSFIEAVRPAVNKLEHGVANVSTVGGALSHVKVGPVSTTPRPLVIDEVLSNGWLRRTVAERVMITNIEDRSHRRNEIVKTVIEFTVLGKGGSKDLFDVYYARLGDGGDDYEDYEPAAPGGSGGSGSGEITDDDIDALIPGDGD